MPPKYTYAGEQRSGFGTYVCTDPGCGRDLGPVGWFFRCAGEPDAPHKPAPVAWLPYRLPGR